MYPGENNNLFLRSSIGWGSVERTFFPIPSIYDGDCHWRIGFWLWVGGGGLAGSLSSPALLPIPSPVQMLVLDTRYSFLHCPTRSPLQMREKVHSTLIHRHTQRLIAHTLRHTDQAHTGWHAPYHTHTASFLHLLPFPVGKGQGKPLEAVGQRCLAPQNTGFTLPLHFLISNKMCFASVLKSHYI